MLFIKTFLLLAFALTRPPLQVEERKLLLGNWVCESTKEREEIIFKNGPYEDGDYRRRWGAKGFKTGFIEESGFWYIHNHGLNFVPTHIENHPRKGNRTEIKAYRIYRRAMDEGAWKPVSIQIQFENKNRFSLQYYKGSKRRFARIQKKQAGDR